MPEDNVLIIYDRALMGDKVEIPRGISVLKNVTGDPLFKNNQFTHTLKL